MPSEWRRWLPSELTLLRVLYARQLPRAEIAARMGRSLEAVVAAAGRLDILKDHRWKRTEDGVLRRFRRIECSCQSARRLGRSRRKVIRRLKELGLQCLACD